MRHYITAAIFVLATYLFAWAGSAGSVDIFGMPGTVSLFLLTFAMQYALFIPSYLMRTEKFFDISGSLTFIAVIGLAYYRIESASDIQKILAAMIGVWTVRLGIFLFARVLNDGGDRRFSEIRLSFPRFLVSWSLQGAWVYIVSSPAIFILTRSSVDTYIDLFTYIGCGLWALGFIVETIADIQKRVFRNNPLNSSAFITTGLWSVSRHPNYLGEIVLWTGLTVVTLPFLVGWELVAILSPVFTYLLLTRVSGINLLEEHAESKWGDMDLYIEYRNKTPKLFPFSRGE